MFQEKNKNASYSVFINGLGNIGCGYDYSIENPNVVLTHAKAFSQVGGFKLIGGCDPIEINRKKFSKRYGVPVFSDIAEGLETLSPFLVVLASPTEFHLQGVETVVNSKSVQIILCEKPLAWTIEDGKKILDLCKEKGIQLFINYMRRANPVSSIIQDRFLNNRKWIKGFGSYTKGLIHNGSHLFNLLEFWFGRPKLSFVLKQGRKFGNFDWEGDFHIQFQSASFTLQSKFHEDYEDNSLEIHTPEGILGYFKGGREITWRSMKEKLKTFNNNSESIGAIEFLPSFSENCQKHVADCLIQEINGFKTNLCTGNEAFQTLFYISNLIKGISNG